MAFNDFPYVNFADLNLDWLLSRIQDVLTLVNSANEQSDDAIELATEANERTLTYAQQIADATADAEEALGLAQDSQDILVIYPDNEGKPVNYKKYMNGETEYIGTDEILTELTLHKRIPFFMDRNQNVFILHGFLDSGTSNTKARFVRSQGNITFFAIIDRNQTISYNSAEDGSLYNVSFNYSDSELVEGWSSDKTFSEILSAINSGKTISLTIKYNGEIRDVVTGTHLTSSSPTVIYFGYTKGVSEVSPMDAYTNAFAYFAITSNDVVTQQAVKYVPNSSVQISGYVLTVNSNGIPEWLPASGGGGTAVQEIVWGYQDEDGGNSVIRRKSDNTIYTAPQMLADESAGKLVLVESPHGIFYLSGARSALASFFNGGTFTMIVANDGQYTEVAVASVPIPEITNTGTQLQVTIDPNKFYVFPNAEELDISFGTETSGKVNEFHFRFTSGSTATQLSLPESVNIPDDFDVVANTVYEISIVDNYMVYSSWAVTV